MRFVQLIKYYLVVVNLFLKKIEVIQVLKELILIEKKQLLFLCIDQFVLKFLLQNKYNY